MPELRHAPTSTATPARSAARPTRPTDLKNRVSVLSGAHAGAARVRALLLQARRFHRRAARVAGRRRRAPAGGARQARRMARRRACATGTSRATRPTSASRSPARPASTSTSGWMRRSATSAASRRCATSAALNFDEYLRADSNAELHHFIGKDIIYFHTLFWPAVLHGAGCRKPTRRVRPRLPHRQRREDVEVARHLHHGAQLPRRGLNPERLRYYFAAKLSAGVDDIDLNLEDFVARVNCDLVGKFVNIASRCAGFIDKRFGGQLAAALPDPAAVRGLRRAARHDRASLRRARLRRGAARHHGAGRRRQPATSTNTSRGCSRRMEKADANCRPSARRASTCSACS